MIARRPDVSPNLSALVMALLTKDPAARPSSAAEVVNFLSASASATAVRPPVDDGTRVLPFLPAAAAPAVVNASVPPEDEAAAILPVGSFDEQEEGSFDPGPKRQVPFLKGIIAAAVLLVGVMIAVLLKEGVSDPTAQAGPPTTPSATVKPVVKPKPTPTPTPSKTPSKKPTPKVTPSKAPKTASPESLRALAKLVRESGDGRAAKTTREAARELEQAAQALAEGDNEQAANKFQDARRRLVQAQFEGRWRSTAQISSLFASIGRTMPQGDGDGEGDNGWNGWNPNE